jgi:hypothetical protein
MGQPPRWSSESTNQSGNGDSQLLQEISGLAPVLGDPAIDVAAGVDAADTQALLASRR